MFHPPANAPHAAVAYRTTALDARRQDRAGGPGRFFKIYIFDDCQIIENNNIYKNIHIYINIDSNPHPNPCITQVCTNDASKHGLVTRV